VTHYQTDLLDFSSNILAFSVLGIVLTGVWIIQSKKKITPPSFSAEVSSSVSRLTLEQLPVRKEIQPEILQEQQIAPLPESVRKPRPKPEPKPKLKPKSKPKIDDTKESLPLKNVKKNLVSETERISVSELMATAQVASTVKGGGNPVPPSLIQELQKMVEKAKYYPSRARRANITGLVILRLTISSKGIIQKTEVLSAEHRYLAAGAKKTGSRIVGKKISVPPLKILSVEIPIRYELNR